ncbi:MAG: PQQ-binding-like beta-propeller repeat protein [Bacteroidota bacterium]
MNNFFKHTILALAVLCSNFLLAQTQKEFPKDINLIKMTASGVAVVGTDDALYGVDANGKELWSNKKLKKVEAERVEVLNGSELIFVSDKGITSRNRVINVLNGIEYANTGTKGENIFGVRVVHGTNQLWVMPGNKYIDVWDIDSNKKLYNLQTSTEYGIAVNKSVALTATFEGMQPITYVGNKEAILHVGLGSLGRYDLTTGTIKWMFDFKPYKLKKPDGDKGDRASNPSKGFAIMKLDEQLRTLYFPFRDMLIAIDTETGTPKWDIKANKSGKVRDMFVTKDGILVLTAKGLQLIDIATGTEKWDKPMKIKGAEEGLLINDGDDFYAVSKGTIVKIDVASKKAATLTEKIKFQGNESFSVLEIINNIIVLSSSQNLVGVDKNSGKIQYAVYYKKPGPSLGTIAQNMALAAVALASTMNSMQVNSQAGNSTYYQYTPALMTNGSNSKEVGNINYISTKFKGADANGFGVARVDKATGKTLEKIVIGDRDPVYDVDENKGLIYYKAGKKSLAIKQIK